MTSTLSSPKKKVMVCLPGLGGHPSVFNEYVELLPEYDLRVVTLIDPAKAMEDARHEIRKAGKTALLCHSYGGQLGVRLADEMPEQVEELLFLEPFFQEHQPWLKVCRPITLFLFWLTTVFARIGVHRRGWKYVPDYVALSKYPIYVQPLFDMRWQGLPEYLKKIYDFLTFRLPQRVETPALMVLSPHGFIRSAKTKEKLRRVFVRCRMVEMEAGTHNVIATDGARVAAALRQALER